MDHNAVKEYFILLIIIFALIIVFCQCDCCRCFHCKCNFRKKNRINIDTQHIQLMNNEIVVIGIPVENLEMNRDNETMEAFVVNIN